MQQKLSVSGIVIVRGVNVNKQCKLNIRSPRVLDEATATRRRLEQALDEAEKKPTRTWLYTNS